MAAELERVVTAARRRLWRAELQRGLARWLRDALLAAVVLLAVDRLWRLRFEPWYPIVALLAAGTLAGVLTSLRRRPGPIAAAAELDRRLGLKERLSSATALGARSDGHPLVAGLLADAERHAAGLDVRRAVPLACTWETRLCLGLAALLVVVAMLPQITFWRSESSLATEQITRQVGTELVELAKQAEQQAEESDAPRAAAEARRLMREALALRRARLSKEQALRRMESLNQQLQRAREEAVGHPLRRSAATARRDLRQVEGPLGEVGRELEDQRAESAAALLRELARAARQGATKPAEAKRLAEQAKQAAEALRDSPHHQQGEALKRAAEALERASREGSREALEQAAEALEQAAEQLAEGAAESSDEALLRDLQEHLQQGKEAVGDAERLRREGEQTGQGTPGGLTERRGGEGPGSGGVDRGPGSTNEYSGPGGEAGEQDAGEGDSPPDLGVGEFEMLYAPRRAETLQQDQRAGASAQRRGGYARTQGPRGAVGLDDSRVPYDRVLERYEQAAEEALSEGSIPLAQRQRVKQYFGGLREPRAGAAGR